MHSSYAFALSIDGPAAAGCLTAAERRVCRGLVSDERRRDWRAGRLAAKRAVAQLRGVRPGAPQPVVSLAHAAGRAAAVASVGPGRVGIDLERAASIHPAHARYFLTRAERSLVRRFGITTLWALKEAAWKALRLGDATVFSALELRANPRRGGEITSLSLHGERQPARILVARPWPGFILAVVWVL